MSATIDTGSFGVIVPDSILSPYHLHHHDPGIRAALEAITIDDDRLAWRLFCDELDDEPEAVNALALAKIVYGKRLKTRKPRRRKAKL